MEQALNGLREVDWKRNAKHWHLRAIKTNGRMISSETAILLTANTIKTVLGLPLDPDEQDREERFLHEYNLLK